MARDRVTANDVALRAGVSQSAVSRVFTPGASASKATVEKVRKAANELGYSPNVLARSLITGKSRIIGLVVAYLNNQFYPDALERLSAELQAQGYHIMVFLEGNETQETDRVFGELLDYQVDGIVAASVSISDGLAQRCEAAGIPVVLFNRGQDDGRLSQVTSDNHFGASEIARYLVAAGHERIAQISGWLGSTTGRDRDAGFRAGLRSAGVDLWASADGLYQREEAIQAARRLCDGPSPPDAIFVGNDHMAFGVLDALRWELGMSVPGDVSVIGYDDVPIAAWPAYDLTTWRQPSGRMVSSTVAALMERIANPGIPPVNLSVEGALVERGSARKPKEWA